jgi:cell division septum initiation protein DivIVA
MERIDLRKMGRACGWPAGGRAWDDRAVHGHRGRTMTNVSPSRRGRHAYAGERRRMRSSTRGSLRLHHEQGKVHAAREVALELSAARRPRRSRTPPANELSATSNRNSLSLSGASVTT